MADPVPLPFVDPSDLGPQLALFAFVAVLGLGGLVLAAKYLVGDPQADLDAWTKKERSGNKSVPGRAGPRPKVDVDSAVRRVPEFTWEDLLTSAWRGGHTALMPGLPTALPLTQGALDGVAEARRGRVVAARLLEVAVLQLVGESQGVHAKVDVTSLVEEEDAQGVTASWRVVDRIRLLRAAKDWGVIGWSREERTPFRSTAMADLPSPLPPLVTDPAWGDQQARVDLVAFVTLARVGIGAALAGSTGANVTDLARDMFAVLRERSSWTVPGDVLVQPVRVVADAAGDVLTARVTSPVLFEMWTFVRGADKTWRVAGRQSAADWVP